VLSTDSGLQREDKESARATLGEFEQLHAATPRTADGVIERIRKLVPSEVLQLWILARNTVTASAGGAAAHRPLIWTAWASFAILTFCNVGAFMLRDPRWAAGGLRLWYVGAQAALAAAAFFVLTLNDGEPFSDAGVDASTGLVVAAIFVAVVGIATVPPWTEMASRTKVAARLPVGCKQSLAVLGQNPGLAWQRSGQSAQLQEFLQAHRRDFIRKASSHGNTFYHRCVHPICMSLGH
jgi:hypothetical protein